MMKQYAVKVTDEALEDMRALRDYIENELLSPAMRKGSIGVLQKRY